MALNFKVDGIGGWSTDQEGHFRENGMKTDCELIADFASTGSHLAFSQLVKRHLDQVYATCKRILNDPPTVCLLKGFGDSSVDLELRFWINDPQVGTSNVRSEVLLKVWDKFHEHNIEIPYPQRDLHIRSSVINMGDSSESE